MPNDNAARPLLARPPPCANLNHSEHVVVDRRVVVGVRHALLYEGRAMSWRALPHLSLPSSRRHRTVSLCMQLFGAPYPPTSEWLEHAPKCTILKASFPNLLFFARATCDFAETHIVRVSAHRSAVCGLGATYASENSNPATMTPALPAALLVTLLVCCLLLSAVADVQLAVEDHERQLQASLPPLNSRCAAAAWCYSTPAAAGGGAAGRA